MKNLIFGGAGFIGANLVTHLLQEGNSEIVVFDNLAMGNQLAKAGLDVELVVADMTSLAAVQSIIRSYEPNRVFHLAANSDIAASALNPVADLNNTMLSTHNLAQSLRSSNVRDLVFASSSAIYGEVEGVIDDSSTPKPVSSYGWMKLASEQMLRALAFDEVVERYLCVRFPNVTGQWQTHGVVKDLVRKLKQNNHVLEVLGDGSQTKPFALASDLVETIVLLTESNRKLLEVNIGPVDRVSVREIVSQLVEISGLNPEVRYGESRSGWIGDVPEYRFDPAKLRSVVKSQTFRSSIEAVMSSIDWEWNHGYESSK